MSIHKIRAYSKKNKNKTKNKNKKSEVDKLIYFAIIIGPLLTIPQVYSIWILQEKGVSIISWVAYLVATSIWLWYGLKHKDLAIITAQVAWVALEVIIIIGLLRIN